jgi:hypothetical protein
MDEEAKLKHSRRIQQKENHIKKQVVIAKQNGHGFYSEVIQQPHRLAKHNAMDCGNPECLIDGNPRKIYKERTKQEKSFDQTKAWDE